MQILLPENTPLAIEQPRPEPPPELPLWLRYLRPFRRRMTHLPRITGRSGLLVGVRPVLVRLSGVALGFPALVLHARLAQDRAGSYGCDGLLQRRAFWAPKQVLVGVIGESKPPTSKVVS